MMVRKENVPKFAQRDTSENQLPRHSVATIDYIGSFISHDHLGRSRAALAWTRPAARSQQNKPCF
jgi:hypothetical protein